MELLLLLVNLVLLGMLLSRTAAIKGISERLWQMEMTFERMRNEARSSTTSARAASADTPPPLPQTLSNVSTGTAAGPASGGGRVPGTPFDAHAENSGHAGVSADVKADSTHMDTSGFPHSEQAKAADAAKSDDASRAALLPENARNILLRIWRWILVGDESGRQGVSLEYAIATTWLTRVGILALVACAGYFLKWSIQNGLMKPAVRISLTTLSGGGLVVAGYVLNLRKRYTILGQAFVGGGLAMLYFSMYALGPMYGFVDSSAVILLLMSVVTLAAGILSLKSESLFTAVVGIVGGFATPVILGTATPNLPVLYGYLLVLDAGIVMLSYTRSWRLLNYVGFLCSVVFFAVSIGNDYVQSKDFSAAMVFIGVFFILQSLIVFMNNFRRNIPCTTLEILHAIFTTVFVLIYGSELISDRYGRPWRAIPAVLMCLAYSGVALALIKTRRRDRPLLLTSMALAVLGVSLALPLALRDEVLTVAWAFMTFAVFWLGCRLSNRFLKLLGYLLYLATFARVIGVEFPRMTEQVHAFSGTWGMFWRMLWDHVLTMAPCFASLGLGIRYGGREPRASDESLDIPQTDVLEVLQRVVFWGSVLLGFIYGNIEVYNMSGLLDAWTAVALTLLWGGTAWTFLIKAGPERRRSFYRTAMFLLDATIGGGLLYYVVSWLDSDRLVLCLADIFAYSLAVLLLFLFQRRLRRYADSREKAVQLAYGALALGLLYSSYAIAATVDGYLADFVAGSLSIWWAVYALAMLLYGFEKQIRKLRYVALCLFIVVAVKVFLFDLSGLSMILRVAALMAFGVLLLLGAVAYMRVGKQGSDSAGVVE